MSINWVPFRQSSPLIVTTPLSMGTTAAATGFGLCGERNANVAILSSQ